MANNGKAPIWFILIFAVIGSVISFFAARGIYKNSIKSRLYIKTEATFFESSLYSSSSSLDSDEKNYRLSYKYEAGNKTHVISTDYGVGAVPGVGTKKTIKYNPDNPGEALFVGFDSNWFLLFFGSAWIAIPVLIFLGDTDVNETHPKLFKGFLGFVFTLMGAGAYIAMCSGGDSLSPIVAFKAFGAWVLLPVIFIVFGFVVLATSFSGNRLYRYNER